MGWGRQLPPLNAKAIALEALARQALGEVVGQLFLRVDLEHRKFNAMMRPEPVELGQEILRPVGDSLINRKIISALVVFKGPSSDGWQ